MIGDFLNFNKDGPNANDNDANNDRNMHRQWQHCIDADAETYRNYSDFRNNQIENLPIGERITIAHPLGNNDIYITRTHKSQGKQEIYDKERNKIDEAQTEKIRCIEISFVSLIIFVFICFVFILIFRVLAAGFVHVYIFVFG